MQQQKVTRIPDIEDSTSWQGKWFIKSKPGIWTIFQPRENRVFLGESSRE